jgi:antitoxin (DNA-binding transcriptional repressor) of toxin-antitoxin stability system
MWIYFLAPQAFRKRNGGCNSWLILLLSVMKTAALETLPSKVKQFATWVKHGEKVSLTSKGKPVATVAPRAKRAAPARKPQKKTISAVDFIDRYMEGKRDGDPKLNLVAVLSSLRD